MKLSIKDNSWVELVLFINLLSVSINDQMNALDDKVKSKGIESIKNYFERVSDDTMKMLEDIEAKYNQLYGEGTFEGIARRVFEQIDNIRRNK